MKSRLTEKHVGLRRTENTVQRRHIPVTGLESIPSAEEIPAAAGQIKL